MIQKLNYATLFVRDQEKALDFYVNALGFQKRSDNTAYGARFLLVGLEGQEVGIVLWKGTPTRPPDAPMGGSGGAWTFETDDLQKTFEQLKAQGVKLEQPEPAETPFGRYAIVTDPDGNRLMILQRKAQPTA